MMFVGAAFSSTVSHCSGVGRRARMAVVCATSAVLVASAAVGGALGNVSRENPAVFTGFVSFGVVALLFLVTHELLIEAHEALKELDVTWCVLFTCRLFANSLANAPPLPANSSQDQHYFLHRHLLGTPLQPAHPGVTFLQLAQPPMLIMNAAHGTERDEM